MPSNQKKQVLRAFSLTLLLLAGLLSLNPAHASLGAVELTLVPLDINIPCGRTFYRSADPSNKTIFTTPHVFVGRPSVDGDEPGVHVVPSKEEGKYILSLDVHFPRNPETFIGHYKFSDVQTEFCNFETALYYINKSIREDAGIFKSALYYAMSWNVDQFKNIAHMPLTSMAVKIDGLDHLKAHVVGKVIDTENASETGESKNVDILEYLNTTYTAEFLIDADDLGYINERITRDEGLEITVNYNFQSVKKNGSVDVDIDGEELSKNFQAGAKGKVKLVKGEIQAQIKTALSKMDIKVRLVEGENEEFNSMAFDITKQIFAGVDFEPTPPELKAEHIELDEPDKAEMASVKAVASFLSSKLSKKVSMELFTPPSKTSADSRPRLKFGFLDPRIVNVKIRDGIGASRFAETLEAGETFKISPFRHYLVRRRWKEEKSFMTMKELESFGVYDIFQEMNNPKMKIFNAERNGQYLAEGWWYSMYYDYFPWDPFYRWKKVKRYPVLAGRVKVRDFKVKTIEQMDWTGIRVSFSGKNRSDVYTLSELLEENDSWSATFKDGSIEITALEDLGRPIISKKTPRPYVKIKDLESGEPYYGDDKDCVEVAAKPKKRGRHWISNKSLAQKEEVSSQICTYQKTFKVGVRNKIEVVQEYYYGAGIGGGKEDSSAFPLLGQIDRWAIDMYHMAEVIVTRPSIIEEQPGTEDINEFIELNDYSPDKPWSKLEEI